MIITALLIIFFPGGMYGEESDKDIFDQARLAYLDEKYDRALNELDRLIEKFPGSDFYPQVLFYKGRCYEKKKMFQKALDNFEECLVVSQNKFLKEEAEISIIDMNFTLYERTGNKKHTEEIFRYLKGKNDVVRYYAAFMLSKLKNKSIASNAVPILKRIIALESDQDLVDRAKLAILRIDPNILKQPSKSKNLKNRLLVIKATNKKTREITFNLSIPFALAGLAVDSLPDDAKEKLKEKGYDLNEIINAIVEKGEILKIESKTSIFKIWIE
jgi:tetratricopeptide (TPR) repeat protein